VINERQRVPEPLGGTALPIYEIHQEPPPHPATRSTPPFVSAARDHDRKGDDQADDMHVVWPLLQCGSAWPPRASAYV
jgi:hypothetical protein